VQPRTRPALALSESLGCALDEGPLGPFFRTDETKETTVRGVFACGDVARGMGSVAFAVGDGARAGMAAHQSLLFRPAEWSGDGSAYHLEVPHHPRGVMLEDVAPLLTAHATGVQIDVPVTF
jgi:pyruvate/2-oxoglutarate dehydrogenase complex dihydrolipoamide dehydrogenase (E3) component